MSNADLLKIEFRVRELMEVVDCLEISPEEEEDLTNRLTVIMKSLKEINYSGLDDVISRLCDIRGYR